jgi:hypothetical protein
MTKLLFQQRMVLVKMTTKGMVLALIWTGISTGLAYLYATENSQTFIFNLAKAIALSSIAYFFTIVFVSFFVRSAVFGQVIFVMNKALWPLSPLIMGSLIAISDESGIAILVWVISLLIMGVSSYFYYKSCLGILAQARNRNIEKGFFNMSNGYVDFVAIPMRKSPEYEKTKEERILFWTRLLTPFLPAMGIGLNRAFGYEVKFFIAIFISLVMVVAILGDVIWEAAFLKEILLIEKSENKRFIMREK